MLDAKHVHIIGIGGIGTSAVAKWFKFHGATVSGSDMAMSPILEELMERGISVKIGHFADNISRDCELVIYSSAIPATNSERQFANERGIKEWSYPKFLGKLAQTKKTIAISGTNGKSTTTAMIASILIEAGLDPTVIVGTKVPGWHDGNLRIGHSNWFVVEACEHMANMLHIRPDIAVITNIEEDHLDYYRDLTHIRETFQEWIECKETCLQVVLNQQDSESMKLKAKYISYFNYSNRQVFEGFQRFESGGSDIELILPGSFNAQNAAAAMTVARSLGIEESIALKALRNFQGTWRRFERIGEYRGATVYSDYAHHPTALIGTIQAFKEFFPAKRLVVVFEPHQHSRTAELFEEFAASFDGADALILAEVYEVAGRTEEKTVSSADLAEVIRSRGIITDISFAKSYTELDDLIQKQIQDGDILAFMGAGTIDGFARRLIA